jgi:hypothetical protein
MKAVILALILIDSLILAIGISTGNLAVIAGGSAGVPSLLWLLLVAVPRAERTVDEMLRDDE